jgi:hypothetical protein
MAQLLESEERPRAMLTTRMTMNLNESNIMLASGLQKNFWIKTPSDFNCDYNYWKHCFCSHNECVWLQHSCVCGSLLPLTCVWKEKTDVWRCQIATRLVFAWCGCNLVKNTGDCKIRYCVVVTTDVLWLQKKQLQKPACACLQPCRSVIAPLSQFDCKKQLQKIMWLRLQKNSCKK